MIDVNVLITLNISHKFVSSILFHYCFILENSGDSLPVIFVAFLSDKRTQYPTHDHLFSCLDSLQHCPRAFLIYEGWGWKRARFVCDICCICNKEDTPIYHLWPSFTSLDSLQHCPNAVLIGGVGGWWWCSLSTPTHTHSSLSRPRKVVVIDISRGRFAVLLRHQMLWYYGVHIHIYIF